MLLLYIFLSVEMDLVIKSAHEAKWKNASGSDDLSCDVSENGQNKYPILLTLLPLFFFLHLLHCICVCTPRQGTSHITCMPGTVRRWNYPPPLCIGKNKPSSILQWWQILILDSKIRMKTEFRLSK